MCTRPNPISTDSFKGNLQQSILFLPGFENTIGNILYGLLFNSVYPVASSMPFHVCSVPVASFFLLVSFFYSERKFLYPSFDAAVQSLVSTRRPFKAFWYLKRIQYISPVKSNRTSGCRSVCTTVHLKSRKLRFYNLPHSLFSSLLSGT